MTRQKVVALTGATGFVGSSILSELIKQGFKVRVLIRNSSKLTPLIEKTEIIYGDLNEISALENLVKDAECLVHCAGRVRGSSFEQFDRDNTIGTRNIADAVSRTKRPINCVYISSLSAKEPTISHYARSKRNSEEILANHFSNSWTIIRPPAIYGPKDTELRPLFDWMRHGILWLPGDKEGRFSLLHVDDLSRLVTDLISLNFSDFEIIEPDDGKVGGYNWSEVKNIASSYFGRKILMVQIPKLILMSLAQLNVLFSKVLAYAPMLTPGKVNELSHSPWVSEKKEIDLIWTPKIDFKSGLSTIYTQ